ncbi:hypothetical protein BS78_02G277500 [Paspalum vaginatum]|nr:hypothetical protein BS78_02G277500 [Paspalum vaginatum]
MQGSFADLAAAVQEMLLGLRRGDDAAVQVKAQSYARLAKTAQKQLKRTNSSRVVVDTDESCCKVVMLLSESREVALLTLGSALRLLSREVVAPSASRWSLVVSKAFQKRRAACEEEQLQALEMEIAGLESALQAVFRRLIQCRVSLLNALSL